MLTSGLLGRCLGISLALLAVSCSSEEKFTKSGFLPNYSSLHEEDAPAGGSRLIWESPNFKPANYKAMILEPMVFYPTPKPSPQVSAATLNEITQDFDVALRKSLSSRIRLTDTPGPGVARFRLALTAAGSESEGLAVYQYIPIALLITGAMALAEGGLPQHSNIGLELQITDSTTDAPLLLLVRGGKGEQLETEKVEGMRPVSSDSLQPLIEELAKSAAEQVTKYISPK